MEGDTPYLPAIDPHPQCWDFCFFSQRLSLAFPRNDPLWGVGAAPGRDPQL